MVYEFTMADKLGDKARAAAAFLKGGDDGDALAAARKANDALFAEKERSARIEREALAKEARDAQRAREALLAERARQDRAEEVARQVLAEQKKRERQAIADEAIRQKIAAADKAAHDFAKARLG